MSSPSRIEADYLVETSCDPRAAAETMAGEQSSGTFVSLPGETPELKERSAARIEALEVVGESASPALPGAFSSDQAIQRARVTLSWPYENLGPSLPNLMATVAGNLFELNEFSGLKITDIRLPSEFAAAYAGPKFGVEGTRALAGVQGRPLIGTIIKPSVGLGPEETADLCRQLVAADIDFIKDDELQSDGPACPFADRAKQVMSVINGQADQTGRKAMYAFNITGELDEMRRRHDLVLEVGGSCIMVSVNSVGLVGLTEMARHRQLPIHAHRNGWGYLSRHPLLGWSYCAWQKFWRLAGVDHMHVNGLSNKFCEDDESVIASARACLTPMFADKPCVAMPVFSSGQTVRQAGETFKALGSSDLIFAAGGGIMGHPDGPGAGVESLKLAWEAALAGHDLETFAAERPSLSRALEAF